MAKIIDIFTKTVIINLPTDKVSQRKTKVYPCLNEYSQCKIAIIAHSEAIAECYIYSMRLTLAKKTG